jgi:hypothetical protein
LRLIATDAIRYWEPRRLVYNVVLLGIVAARSSMPGRHHVVP